jgi:hypothetical protein
MTRASRFKVQVCEVGTLNVEQAKPLNLELEPTGLRTVPVGSVAADNFDLKGLFFSENPE